MNALTKRPPRPTTHRRYQRKLLTTYLTAYWTAVVTPWMPSAARADSAVATDTVFGSALNLGLMRGSDEPRDPDNDPFRSPIGFLYLRPPLDANPPKTGPDGWTYRGTIEAGGSATQGDSSAYYFQRYKDVANGGYVRYFSGSAEQEQTAHYIEGYGGEVGRSDQYYSLSLGRYNDWKLSAFFTEIPSVYSTSYRSLWSGVGSGNLTLNGLTPGGSSSIVTTQNNIQAALATTQSTTLAVDRKTAGLRYDLNLGENWKLYASYSNQHREGARPFGLTFGAGDGSGNIDDPESIDTNTHDIVGGVQFNDALQSFNLQLSASLFRNAIDTMTVQNPLAISSAGIAGLPPNLFTTARYDLEPDNDYYKAKAEYAHSFPSVWNSRLTASLAWSRSRQNDALIAPTTQALSGGSINGVATANAWNTTSSLLQQTADTQIDATLANLRFITHPSSALALTGTVRYYGTDNSSAYTACNPLTGQWGRLLNDGSGTAIVNNPTYLAAGCNLAAVQALNLSPNAGNINIRSIPFDAKQTVYTLTADYRLNPKSNLTGTIEQASDRYSNRERDETFESRFKLGYTNRAWQDAVLLISYEYDHRGGSAYNSDPYAAYYSESLGPVPTAAGTNMANWIVANSDFRDYDLADRNQNIVKARLNWTAIPSLDLGLTAQYKDIRYPDSAYGRNGSNGQTSLSLNLDWEPAVDWGLYASYTWQNAKQSQTGLQANSCIMGSTYYFFSNGSVSGSNTPPPGTTLIGTSQLTPSNWQQLCMTAGPLSPLFPSSQAWANTQQSINQTLALGGHYNFSRARFDLSYTYANGRSKTGYSYNAAALGLDDQQQALVGSGMPDTVFVQSIVDASLLVPINTALAIRLYYHYEDGRQSDWHYDGVQQNPVPAPNSVYLDYGPQSYHASIAGLFLRYSF